MGKITRRSGPLSRHKETSLVHPIIQKGTASPLFAPILGVAAGVTILTLILYRSGVDTIWMAGALIALGVVGLAVYLPYSARQTRRRIEERRAEFYRRQFEDRHDS